VPGLIFEISELLIELEVAKGLVHPFVSNGASVFSELRTQLEGFQTDPSEGTFDWNIPKERPLRTSISRGEYEPGGGGVNVVGELSFTWRIKRIKLPRSREPAKQFRLAGIASTIARVFECNGDESRGEQLAMWRTEVGDDGSPGCHFHSQILGEKDEGPFPSRLSVPRLPACLPSPMTALEFLLAELFQDRWKRYVFLESAELKRWRSIQRERLRRLLKWQDDIVRSGLSATPWTTLKYAKPPEGLFVS
jgi:hypothetical protein